MSQYLWYRSGTPAGASGGGAAARGPSPPALWEPRHLWEQRTAAAGSSGASGSSPTGALPDEPDCQTLSWQARPR